MAMEEVKLLGQWASPFVLRARVALGPKGVKYEFLEEDEMVLVKSELLLMSNPVYKKLPVLIHAGKPLCESMIIVQYVDETWAGVEPPIMPADPYERAVARFWTVYINDKLWASLSRLMLEETDEGKAQAANQMLEGLQLLEGAFKECSKGKGFFGGDNIGYLDIALGCCLMGIKVIEKLANSTKVLDESKTPLLVGWAERFLSHPVVKEVMPEFDRLTVLLKKVQALLRASAK